MNSKELLEQAEIRVKRINELSDSVGAAEDVLTMLGEGEVCFFTSGIGTTHLTPVLSPEKMQKLREMVVTEIILARNEKTAELEQLLGIQSVPEIPPLAKGGLILGVAGQGRSSLGILVPDTPEVVVPDPVEKSAEKFDVHSITAEDKSLEKYPAKKDKRKKYPENMTVEAVTKMYVNEGKNRREIAAYYGVKESAVNNFLFLHDIKRKKASKPDKQPEEKEYP